MSKFVRLNTTLTDKSVLMEALKSLNCEILKGKQVPTLLGRRHNVDLLVKTPLGVIGFIQNAGGQYELAGDDMILSRHKNFMGELTQRYTHQKVLAEARKAGFTVVKETSLEDGSIKLTVRRW